MATQPQVARGGVRRDGAPAVERREERERKGGADLQGFPPSQASPSGGRHPPIQPPRGRGEGGREGGAHIIRRVGGWRFPVKGYVLYCGQHNSPHRIEAVPPLMSKAARPCCRAALSSDSWLRAGVKQLSQVPCIILIIQIIIMYSRVYGCDRVRRRVLLVVS